jgi:4'-phosphopantetheinyl transferase EntD
MCWLSGRTPSWDRLLFSAKESVYKAWYPLVRSWLGPQEADITIEPAEGTFEARLLIAPSAVRGASLGVFSGRFLARDGLILTAVTCPAGSG